METNAEHDFRLKRLIGMLRTIERAQIFCAICQAMLPGRPFDTQILFNQRPRCKQRGIKLAALQSSGIFEPHGSLARGNKK